jgi:aminoglycoside phosphotransferase (APT) family kinase protein
MEFRPIARDAGAFQESLSDEQIQAICRRIFDSEALAAAELGLGMYNNTYRLEVKGQSRPVVLRVAPAPQRQFRSERELMRNEYATVPWLASLAALMPRVVAADWTHEVVGRDYLVQTFLHGLPAPEHLGSYPRSAWAGYYRQLGTIAGRVHAIRGQQFGWVAGPGYPSWSDAVVASLVDIAADVEQLGLDAADLRAAVAAAERHRDVLDEIREPRLLAGDLWNVNVMLDPHASEPTITGMLDLDRTWWGDPAADWTIRMAAAKPGTERDAFWETYGKPDRSESATARGLIYELRHLGSIRLERHRLDNTDGVRSSYGDVAALLDRLA